MCRFVLYTLYLCFCYGLTFAQTTPPSAASNTFDFNAPAEAQVPTLYAAWQATHDPVEREDRAAQIVEGVMREYVRQEPQIVDEVARDGLPVNVLRSSAPVEKIALEPLTVLMNAHSTYDDYPPSPVFRRMSANRFEAWTPKEGWLFDWKGKLLSDVHPPRRDGSGKQWFGAFLPDGTWITTDLWANDEQLNCFSSTGKWKWELTGEKILDQLPKAKASVDLSDQPTIPSIGWARADRTGRRWLVCLGVDYTRSLALVGPTGRVQAVPEQVSAWKEVYPRAMGVRGMFTSMGIDSDDGKSSLSREEAGHGIGVGWPNYSLSNGWAKVIHEGDDVFGFWPGAHRIYAEGYESMPEPWHAPKHVWFFAADGKYEGEIMGTHLADAANGRDLLIQDADHQVVQVAAGKDGLAITGVRAFTWADGTTAMPLAIYEDLKLGFFLRGPGLTGYTDDSRRAQGMAEVVLASWR